MGNKMVRLILGSLLICLATRAGWASSSTHVYLELDQTYDRQLQWQNSADKDVTPAKVIRWMRGMRGEQLSAPSNIEFQPIFKAHNGQSIYVAALAYKF
jgi:hypothetical protein